MNHTGKRILLAGGGSGGPVMPLLAVADELKKLDSQIGFLFVGTKNGPEKKMVESAGLPFRAIPAAKLRRYFSIANFTDGFVFIYSFFVARKILKEYRPDIVFSAGGFVAVPISWAAKLMGIRVAVHQQDAQVGLANRLIAPFATLITTAFESTSKEFASGNGLNPNTLKPAAEWVGNPVRKEFFSPASPDAKQKFGLNESLPILVITGGATGASQINEVVEECISELVKSHQVIHILGQNKDEAVFKDQNYHPYQFLTTEMADALKIADMVIARAGLSTIAELSVLGKIAIIVPMPDTHQERNGDVLKEKAAAVVLNKHEFTADDLPRIVNSLKFNVARRKLLAENIHKLMPHDAAARIANLLYERLK